VALTEPETVQQEVLAYFEALFNCCHQVAADMLEPFDSGQPFTTDEACLPTFLEGHPCLEQAQAVARQALSRCLSSKLRWKGQRGRSHLALMANSTKKSYPSLNSLSWPPLNAGHSTSHILPRSCAASPQGGRYADVGPITAHHTSGGPITNSQQRCL
jgi:hypothetical protein